MGCPPVVIPFVALVWLAQAQRLDAAGFPYVAQCHRSMARMQAGWFDPFAPRDVVRGFVETSASDERNLDEVRDG